MVAVHNLHEQCVHVYTYIVQMEVLCFSTVTVLQGDAVDESIVYVSEPQPLAHTSEEVIDMVENPVTSDVQVQDI